MRALTAITNGRRVGAEHARNYGRLRHRPQPTGANKRLLPFQGRAGAKHEQGGGAFASLIDAKAAGKLLGVPHTWLLAQARARRIPHHRLGHYVRFDPDDLKRWLKDTRLGPDA